MHKAPQEKSFFGKTYFLGHGDGLGPGDHGYKFIKWVFRNPFFQWLYARVHPNLGIGIASYFSRASRRKTGHKDAHFLGEKEFMIIFATRETAGSSPEIDYFIFGHRHYPITYELEDREILLQPWRLDYPFHLFGN